MLIVQYPRENTTMTAFIKRIIKNDRCYTTARFIKFLCKKKNKNNDDASTKWSQVSVALPVAGSIPAHNKNFYWSCRYLFVGAFVHL